MIKQYLEDFFDFKYNNEEEYKLECYNYKFSLISKEQKILLSRSGSYNNKTDYNTFITVVINNKETFNFILLYFIKYIEKFNLIVFENNYAKIYFKVLNDTYKKQNQMSICKRKKLSKKLAFKIKHSLMFYKEGYVFVKNQNTSLIFNRRSPFIQGHSLGVSEILDDCFLEYIERLASSVSLKEKVFGSYKDLKNQYDCINPRELGVYTKTPKNLCNYEDELEFYWVESTSLINNKTYLIPEQYSQYLLENQTNQFINENSNGCALGSTREEAIYYGLLEAIEREVFLRFWFDDKNKYLTEYNILSDFKNYKYFFDFKGYELRIFSIKNDLDVYVIVACIFDKSENIMKNLIGTSAHTILKIAIDSAIGELYYAFKIYEENPEQLKMNLKNLESKNKLIHLEDHVLYYSLNKNRSIMKNKFINSISKNVNLNHKKLLLNEEENINYCIQEIISKAKKYYEDVLFVDQTSSIIESFNLNSVKVILKGGICLDFGSEYIRTNNNLLYKNVLDRRNYHPIG